MAAQKSLTKRIRLSFILIAALPLLGFGLLSLPVLEDALTKDAFEHNHSIANSLSASIESYLHLPLHSLHMLKRVSARFPGSSEPLKSIMEEIVQSSGIIEALYVTDESHRIIHLGLTPALSSQRNDFLGLDLSSHSLFRSLPRDDGTIWSDTFTSLLTGKPAISAGLPLDKQMLIANISLEQLNTILLREINSLKGTEVVVVDGNGVVIAHSNPDQVKTQINLYSHPAIRQGLSGKENTQIYTVDGKKVLGTVLHIPSTGWEVYLARDMDVAMELLRTTRMWLIIAILIAMGMAVTAGIQSARNFGLPIQTLSEQTRKIAEGDYTTSYVHSDFEEIAQLTSDFATMGAAVQEREQALQDKTDECRMIFNTSNDGISLAEIDGDRLGRYSETNEVLLKRVGYSREELSALTPLDLLTPESREKLEDLVEQLQTREHLTFEVEQVNHNGEKLPVEMTARIVKIKHREMVYILSRDIRDRLQAAEVIEKMAFFDSLTGLPNRHLLQDRIAHALSNAKRDDITLSVMFVNLDRLKAINDNYGHDFGDRVLHETGRRLSSTIRGNDVVGRWGGDEFVILLWQVANPEHCNLVAKKIIRALNEPLLLDGQEISISASIGISLYPQDADNADQLVTTADMAMQHAKREGHNGYQFYSQSMNSWAMERMQLENSLRFALERNEFQLHYQPRVDSLSLEAVGIEALLRWEHPQLGRVSPDRFIPIAEETGMIRSIGEWVLRTACRQAAELHRLGHTLRLGVNVSAQQLRHGNFYQQVERALADSRFDPEFLEIELTERALVDNSDGTLKLFNQLRRLGVHLALDDFGVGYSSLAQLQQFPLDILKIDRSFINGIPDDHNMVAITEAIMAMGMSLEMEIIAEGIETEDQEIFLAARDCNSLQGFRFSRPLPFDELVAYLGNQPLRKNA